MPGLGQFSRGTRLLKILNIVPSDNEQQQQTNAPDESPLPAGAEKPSNWYLNLFTSKPSKTLKGPINAVQKFNLGDSRPMNHAVTSTSDGSNSTPQVSSGGSLDVRPMDRTPLQQTDTRSSLSASSIVLNYPIASDDNDTSTLISSDLDEMIPTDVRSLDRTLSQQTDVNSHRSINAVRKLNFADSRGLNNAVSSTNDASNTTLQDSDESSDVESMDRNTLQHNDIRNSSSASIVVNHPVGSDNDNSMFMSSDLDENLPVDVRPLDRTLSKKADVNTSHPLALAFKRAVAAANKIHSSQSTRSHMSSEDVQSMDRNQSLNISTCDEATEETDLIFDAEDIDHSVILNRILSGENDVTLDLPVINIEGNTQDIEENNNILERPNNPMPEANVPGKKLSRKRSRNPEAHKAAVAKRALYSGEAHLNRTGKLRPAPTMRLPCACKFQCRFKITEEERLAVFKLYTSGLGCKDKQWAFIRAHSTSTRVTKSTVGNETPQRKVSRKYFFQVTRDGKKKDVPVCKVMFMNTLAIWDGVIHSAWSHVNEETKTPTPDKRGRHKKRPKKTTEDQKEIVRNHINSYPRIPSHYVRSRIQREYVENGLSCAKMFRQYKLWCTENSIAKDKTVSENQYRQIFNNDFNIGFFKPKKDRCQLCTLMKTGTRAERERYQRNWVDHYNSKKASYNEQRKARSLLSRREDVAMLSFDLQKVLPCPKSETSPFFYKNKLSVYNLTVFDSAPALGTCYIWHAGEAKRGANEIGSAVMQAYSHCANEGKKEILSFSDSCAGQNKNRFIYAMMLNTSAKYSIKIRHCFLTPGHTYNDADGVHARIEAATRGKDIYDLNEWTQHIKHAKENDPMYVVKRLKRSDVYDLKELVSKQQWDKDEQGNKVEWNKVKIVEAGYDDKGVLGFYYKIGGERHTLQTKKRRGHPVNLSTYQPKPAYESNIPLKAKTVKHLKELCKSLAIPSKYHNFYNNIFANIDPTEEEDEIMDVTVDADSFDPDEILDEDGTLENQMAEEGDEDEEDVDGDLEDGEDE